MKNRLIIAESGGTKTDWVWIEDGEVTNRISTGSYHPNRLTNEWIEKEMEFWNGFSDVSTYVLRFYGSGCLSVPSANRMAEVLTSFGFTVEEVTSDLHAAGKAVWGDGEGWIAILGTGSVLAYYAKGEILDVRGGYGYLLGDEGGGYYFGKMLVQHLLSLGEELGMEELANLGCSSRSDLFSRVYGAGGKEFLSGLAKENANRYSEISRKNLENFAIAYLFDDASNKQIGIVGTYGSKQANLVEQIFATKGWEVQKFIERPVDELLKCYVKRSF